MFMPLPIYITKWFCRVDASTIDYTMFCAVEYLTSFVEWVLKI